MRSPVCAYVRRGAVPCARLRLQTSVCFRHTGGGTQVQCVCDLVCVRFPQVRFPISTAKRDEPVGMPRPCERHTDAFRITRRRTIDHAPLPNMGSARRGAPARVTANTYYSESRGKTWSMLGYFNASQASCWCDAASLKTRGQLLLAEQCASSCEPGPWRTDTVFVRTKSRRRPTTSGCQGCVRDEHASQHGEDLLLLPMLLRASGVGQPGTFVELGALNGRLYSNTLLLERCFGWNGLLIEALPHNFEKLVQSGRSRSRFVHSAVCKDGVNQVEMQQEKGNMLQATATSSADIMERQRAAKGIFGGAHLERIRVPCRPLSRIMHENGLPNATFLSLDVEGAEAIVLETVDPAAFGVVMVEVEGSGSGQKDARVHALLERAGLRLFRDLLLGFAASGGHSRLYINERTQAHAAWTPEWSRVSKCEARCGIAAAIAQSHAAQSLPSPPSRWPYCRAGPSIHENVSYTNASYDVSLV